MLCCNELCDAVTGRVYVCGLTMNIEQVMDVGMCAARRASECVRVHLCVCVCVCVVRSLRFKSVWYEILLTNRASQNPES